MGVFLSIVSVIADRLKKSPSRKALQLTRQTTTLPFQKTDEQPMIIEDLKSAIKSLPTEDRRKLALFILELEKDHVKDAVGPQIREDLEGLSKKVQETFGRMKKHVKEKL
jgi:hypothetical protein